MGKTATAGTAFFVLDPVPLRARSAVRYGLAFLLVVGVAFWGLAALDAGVPDHDVASDAEGAVMIDLPPADAAPVQGLADQAVAPTAPVAALPPPRIRDDPQRELPLAADPLVASDPDVRPSSAQQAIQAAQAATGPTGVAVAVESQGEDQDAVKADRARRITLWQKALLSRLESAKHALGLTKHAAGTVEVAFVIDAAGNLVSERLVVSSGRVTLDHAALSLVSHAAPFPTPPVKARASELSFIVPVRFRP